MKKIATLLLLTVLVSFISSTQVIAIEDFWGEAMQESKQEENKQSWSYDKQIKYFQGKKYPWLAVTTAQLFPSLGHLYAGNWLRGWKFLGLELAEGYMVIKGSKDNKLGITVLGIITLIGTKLWETEDAHRTAQLHNAQLKKKIMINFDQQKQKATVSQSYNF